MEKYTLVLQLNSSHVQNGETGNKTQQNLGSGCLHCKSFLQQQQQQGAHSLNGLSCRWALNGSKEKNKLKFSRRESCKLPGVF